MSIIITAPSQEIHLETQATLYPTLQHLVCLLPLDHRRVTNYLQEEAKRNPFLVYQGGSQSRQEVLINDVLPEWYNTPATEANLQEHLSGQISALSLPSRQRSALVYLTQWLSPAGYLEETPQIWAQGSDWSAKELQELVSILHSLDPPGIGARSLKECLLLQLAPQTLAALLVEDYLEDLAACIGNSISAQQSRENLLQLFSTVPIETSIEALVDAIHQIQALEPRPGRNFSYSPVALATPDLKVDLISGVWQVSLAYEVERDFVLNEEALAALAKSNRRSAEAQRLEVLLRKAQNLMTAVKQWQENLLKVGQFLVNRAELFLNTQDELDLLPTPQQLVAQAVGVSNATVSRIVRERYLLVSGLRIIRLRSLCAPLRVGGRTSLQVQQLLRQIIQTEPATAPYSDDQLAQLIERQYGIPIARRTVTKYRQLAGIDSSHRRRDFQVLI